MWKKSGGAGRERKDWVIGMNKAVYHAKDLVEKGESFVVAEIVDSMGSAPRKKGYHCDPGAYGGL